MIYLALLASGSAAAYTATNEPLMLAIWVLLTSALVAVARRSGARP
jgi:hypothetical protein